MSASNVPTALTIHELLSRIFLFASQQSIATSMQVSSFWATVGKPELWRVLDTRRDLEGLLKILLPWTEGFEFWPVSDEEAKAIDWDRFLTFSTLVHHLRVSEDELDDTQKIVASVLGFISRTHAVSTVFPNLRTLQCPIDEVMLQPTLDLLHTGVQSLYLVHQEYPYITDPLRDLIPCKQLSSLVYLEVFGYDEIEDLLPTFLVLQQLPHLATIVLPSHTMNTTMLGVLSLYPALKEINTKRNPDSHPCDGKHLLIRQLKKDAFPVLTSLTISVCTSQLSEILDNEHFPSEIESLVLESVDCRDDLPVVEVYSKLAQKFGTASKLQLCDVVKTEASSFTSLRPFLHWNLTQLKVETPPGNPLSYNCAEMEELLHSLPMIEILDLQGGFLFSYPSTVETFTINHLPLFARHCPKLLRFNIGLDATKPCNTLPHDIIPFAALQTFDLGWTFEFESFDDDEVAATLFSKLLPHYTEVMSHWSKAPLSFYRALAQLRDRKEVADRLERPGWSIPASF
ncbi:hypothetical protein DXG01_010399 [Tephrocybe rancida]|nr:hypothetical protein DXG01_010399 [Tephrocybe rancida]